MGLIAEITMKVTLEYIWAGSVTGITHGTGQGCIQSHWADYKPECFYAL